MDRPFFYLVRAKTKFFIVMEIKSYPFMLIIILHKLATYTFFGSNSFMIGLAVGC